MLNRIAMWVLGTGIVAGAAFAAAQELPQGEGKKLIEERCASCHGLVLVADKKLPRDAWKDIVARMVGYGATLDKNEENVANDYLAKYFGPSGPDSPAPDEKTAKRFIDGICASCHDASLITETRATREGWLDIVVRMNGRGAGLSDKDTELLAEYLARNYGSK